MLRVARTTLRLMVLAGCAGWLLSTAGCGQPRGGVVHAWGADRVANLALGPTRDHTWLAESFAYRSSWPSVELGYVFDDLSSYTEVIYDDESYYSGLYGGGFTREAVSVRTGVLVR